MKNEWREIPIEEYKKIVAESSDDKDFRRRLKAWRAPTVDEHLGDNLEAAR